MQITSIARARAGISGLTAALAVFGLLSSPLGLALAPQASAQSLTAERIAVQAPYPFTEVDPILIDEVGYDVGGDGFSNGSPNEPATLTWTHAWFGVYPELKGKIHFEGAERCARVKMIALDESGAQIGDPDFSDVVCPGDLGHNARVIKEGGSDGLSGRAGAAKVKIVLQTQHADLSWSNAGQQTVAYGPVLDTDDVKILADGVDLGSGAFNDPSPVGAATLTWKSTGGPINPELRGMLYIKDSADLCFRTKVTYKKHDGVELETRTGTERCVTDDNLHTYPVLMNAYFHNEVAEITYALEKRGGTGVWQTVGEKTVELGEPLLTLPNPGPRLP